MRVKVNKRDPPTGLLSKIPGEMGGQKGLVSIGGSIPGIDRRPANQLSGNAGNDRLVGGSDYDFLSGGTGNDSLDGRGGFDLAGYDFGQNNEITGVALLTTGVTFSAAQLTSAAAVTTLDAGVLGNDTLTNIEGVQVGGTNFADNLTGSALADQLFGRAGNDILNGGDGDDYLSGNAGDDSLDGGIGNDTAIFSGNRNNFLVERLVNGTLRVTDLRTTGTTDGIDILTNIETLRFIDGNVLTSTFG